MIILLSYSRKVRPMTNSLLVLLHLMSLFILEKKVKFSTQNANW